MFYSYDVNVIENACFNIVFPTFLMTSLIYKWICFVTITRITEIDNNTLHMSSNSYELFTPDFIALTNNHSRNTDKRY